MCTIILLDTWPYWTVKYRSIHNYKGELRRVSGSTAPTITSDLFHTQLERRENSNCPLLVTAIVLQDWLLQNWRKEALHLNKQKNNMKCDSCPANHFKKIGCHWCLPFLHNQNILFGIVVVLVAFFRNRQPIAGVIDLAIQNVFLSCCQACFVKGHVCMFMEGTIYPVPVVSLYFEPF